MAKVKDAKLSVAGAGGVFDEDRGDDEVFAEVELLARSTDVRVIKTNTVKGDFSAGAAQG
ncbi:MAG: hypothetical protein ACR2HR_13325 [Euzebya sp.]